MKQLYIPGIPLILIMPLSSGLQKDRAEGPPRETVYPHSGTDMKKAVPFGTAGFCLLQPNQ